MGKPVIHLTIDSALLRRTDAWAAKTRRSRVACVELALEEWLEKQGAPETPAEDRRGGAR